MLGTLVVTVSCFNHTIAVEVSVDSTTATHTGSDFIDVIRTLIITILGIVTISVYLSLTTTTVAGVGGLGRIMRANISAIRECISVGVGISSTTATQTRSNLVGITRAIVDTVGIAIAVRVSVGSTTTTDARE
jgi:hypothetical protein